MAIRIVRLGSPRKKNEGLRIGTVRRPPRGVPKEDYAAKNIYDLWYPNLAPSEALLREAPPAENAKSWKLFRQRYLKEMKTPVAKHDLNLLAALSHKSDFSLGCYCANEARCHRSILKELLQDRGAEIK